MSNIDKQAYRADGGDIGTGRLREIADNPYGDEEKCWLAKRVLAVLDELEAAAKQNAQDVQIKARLCRESNSLHDRLREAEKRIAEFEFAQSLYDEGVSMLCGQFDELAAAMGWTSELAEKQGVSQLEYARGLKLRIAELQARDITIKQHAQALFEAIANPSDHYVPAYARCLREALNGTSTGKGE